MERYCYFLMSRKSDGKEVYTSPAYTRDGSDVIDYNKVGKTLQYYFDRVNGGIKQQLESPKLSDEQKQELKYLDVKDYEISYVQNRELGCALKIYWTVSAETYIKDYKYA